MNRMRWSGSAIAVVVALAAGWWIGRASAPEGAGPVSAPAQAPAERRILYYRNPMGLPDTSPVPKKDGMGMDYVPVFADEEPAAEPGTVVLPPDKVQKLGVRTERAVRETLAGIVRASATVQVDETRQFAIAPKFGGWVETLHANQTGMTVRRGQPLMALYSPELVATRSEYQIADAAARRLAAADPASAATMRQLRDAARTRLRNWDIGGAPVTRTGSESLVLTAPADAVVIEKRVVQGDRFEPGQTILRLADLSTVWIVADVPTSASAGLAVGNGATFQTPSLPGKRFEGRVSFIQPVVNLASRTIGVRIELANPDGVLRPGLFGDVDLVESANAAAVVIPRSAVIDSGTRQLVLVQTAPGRFAPRSVRLGQRAGERIEVLSGVEAGETVVVSANFLIDAESSLRSALPGVDPVDAPAPASGSGAAADPAQPRTAPADPEEAAAGADPHAGHTGDE